MKLKALRGVSSWLIQEDDSQYLIATDHICLFKVEVQLEEKLSLERQQLEVMNCTKMKIKADSEGLLTFEADTKLHSDIKSFKVPEVPKVSEAQLTRDLTKCGRLNMMYISLLEKVCTSNGIVLNSFQTRAGVKHTPFYTKTPCGVECFISPAAL